MIEIGKRQKLKIKEFNDHGAILSSSEEDTILLPGKEIPLDAKESDLLDVFVYCDSKARPIATVNRPIVEIQEIGYLEIVGKNDFGVFANWGVPKDLFIPHKNQHTKMLVGSKYFITPFFDEFSERMVGTSNINFMLKNNTPDFKEGEQVEGMIYEKTDLGYKVIVANKHWGLLFNSDIHKTLPLGSVQTLHVKKIREDNKIDLAYFQQSFTAIEGYAETLLEEIIKEGGFLPLSDKSTPEEISSRLGVSKKMFKKACGTLYKKKKISILDNGLKLVK